MCWGRVVKIIDTPPKKKNEKHQQSVLKDFLLYVSFFFVQIHQTEMQRSFSHNNKIQQKFRFFKLIIKNLKHPLLIKVLGRIKFGFTVFRLRFFSKQYMEEEKKRCFYE